jgi:nicotinamidase-related amidase
VKSALLIVDMQNDFVLEGASCRIAGALASVPYIVKLLAAARAHSWLVVHVVREHRADGADVELPRRAAFARGGGYAVAGTAGAEIICELTPLAGEHCVVKPRFSAFMRTGLDALLREHGVERVVVCGTQYPNCIRATAFDALALDYHVVVAQDATSAQSLDVARANIVDLNNVGIACLAVAELIAQMANSPSHAAEVGLEP